MKTYQRQLEEVFSEAVEKALHTPGHRAEVTISQKSDYQCNTALKLAKSLGQNPRLVAKTLVDYVAEKKEALIESLEIAGPGFINITIHPHVLAADVSAMMHDPLLGAMPFEKRERVVVDYSSPNIAKALHVGHLRSTIIGDAIARLFEFLGANVLRLNHVGDWGTQFGMLITYLKRFAQHVIAQPQNTSALELLSIYQSAKERFDADVEFKRTAQEEVVKLQNGDVENIAIWKSLCDISRVGFDEIYQLLDIHLTERGESFYNPLLKDVVDDLERKGLITVSEGAKCIFMEGFQTKEGAIQPLIVLKSDGGAVYATTDIAALRHRVNDENASMIFYVIDATQSRHIQMFTKACQLAGYYDNENVRVEHVPFGLVLTPDGSKMKTRSGKTEQLIDLIKEAIYRAKQIAQERLPDASDEEIEQIAHVVGVGALKYADLSINRMSDYIFSYEKMLCFEGNSAVAILYAYVRTRSLLRKVNVDGSAISLTHPQERALALVLRRFGETLLRMSRELLPNLLTDYLYELSVQFNAFYRDCPIHNDPQEKSRIALTHLTGQVIARGLAILGISTLERM